MQQNKLEPSTCKTITCECGHDIFTRGVVIKEVPAMALGPESKLTYSYVEILYCQKCGLFSKGSDEVYTHVTKGKEKTEDDNVQEQENKSKIIKLNPRKDDLPNS